MRKRTISLLALAAVLPLMGQGCSMQQSARINTSATSPSAQVDAAVNAELNTASDVNATERSGDSDADLMNTDKTQLDSYSQTQYDLP